MSKQPRASVAIGEKPLTYYQQGRRCHEGRSPEAVQEGLAWGGVEALGRQGPHIK